MHLVFCKGFQARELPTKERATSDEEGWNDVQNICFTCCIIGYACSVPHRVKTTKKAAHVGDETKMRMENIRD